MRANLTPRRPDAPGDAGAWPTLQSCTPHVHRPENWSVCRTDAFESHLRRVQAISTRLSGAPLALSELQLPQNTRILFSGHSYLLQVVHELYCGGSFVLDDGGLFSHFTMRNVGRNVTAVVLVNDEALQHSRALASGALRAFLQTHRFDLAFFTPAHADCFFAYTKAGRRGRAAKPCIDLADASENGSEARNARVWQLLGQHTRLAPPVLVRPWRPYMHREWTISDWPPRWAGPVSARETVDGSAFVNLFPCKVPHCDPIDMGHQCRPGAVSLVARALATRARALGRDQVATPPAGRARPERQSAPILGPLQNLQSAYSVR